MPPEQVYTVSDAAAVINQTLEYAYPIITIVGEVAEYKISGGKWVFFNIKDDEMSLKCFAPTWNIRTPIEDGMQVQIMAKPRLGKYGFSLNIEAIKPVGEGSIKKAFEILRRKLDAEGLFAPERKRALPTMPLHIGVVSSIDAAGFKDFIKILGQRFGGIRIEVANTAVQGETAADQIIRAIRYFNESKNPPEVIAILRGGGARDDLVAFDDEMLVRAIAGSRVPTIVGVGHEIDITLSDLAADVRASTPSNAAEILVPSVNEINTNIEAQLKNTTRVYTAKLQNTEDFVSDNINKMATKLISTVEEAEYHLKHLSTLLSQLNPKTILKNGYAIVRDKNNHILKTRPSIGDEIKVENQQAKFTATVNKIL
jgi:exodeoxyribonuclease VII large subunit